MRFGVRAGVIEDRSGFQTDDMDDDLRNSLYNFLYETIRRYWDIEPVYDEETQRIYRGLGMHCSYLIWKNFWRRPIDEYSDNCSYFLIMLKNYISGAKWYEIYELLEFIYSETQLCFSEDQLKGILEREMSGFRFQPETGLFIRVIDPVEINSLNNALNLSGSFETAKSHMEKAIGKLSQKPAPDLANAVKEAISSVEAAARVVSGKKKATLGDAIKALEKSGCIHSSLKGAWEKMYGYTSDSNGIRHASIGNDDLNFDIAKYFLVTCSAFVNLLSTLPAEDGK